MDYKDNNWNDYGEYDVNDAGYMTPAPKPKKKTGLVVAVSAAAVVLIALVVVLIVTLVGDSDVVVTDNIGDGVMATAGALSENKVVASIGDALDEGSIEVRMDMAKIAGAPNGTDVAVKLYTGENRGVLTANMNMYGSEVFDAGIFCDENSLALACDTLLNGKAYGISLNDLENRLNNSIFGPYGEYSLGVDFSEVGPVLATAKELSGFYESYFDMLGSMYSHYGTLLEKNAVVEKGEQTLTFGGSSVETLAVTMKLDANGFAGYVKDYVEFITTNEEMKAYMREAYALMGHMTGMDTDELLDMMYAELASGLEEMTQEIRESGAYATISYNNSKTTGELVNFNVQITIDGETLEVSLRGGPSWSDLEVAELRIATPDEVIRGSFVVTADDENTYAANLNVFADDENVFVGDLYWNRKAGDFKAEAKVDGDTYGINGNMLADGSTTTIALDSVYENSYSEELGITVVLRGEDEMPKMPAFTDLLSMSAAEFEALQQDITSAAMALARTFG